jgi:hypothetical protein
MRWLSNRHHRLTPELTVAKPITLHGADIEFDKDNELCFDFDPPRSFFYLTEKETIELRDYLIAATASDRMTASSGETNAD